MSQQQTGGRFDPDDRHIYFTVGAPHDQTVSVEHHRYLLVPVNVLTDSDEPEIRRWFDQGAIILLDSGIFWLANAHARTVGISLNEALACRPEDLDGFDDLLTHYVDTVRKYEDRLWGYIELDQGGTDNKRRLRAHLQSLGLRPIPVYHPQLDPWDYFDELATDYDRVCVGGIARLDAAQRKRFMVTIAERHRQYPDLWIHLLGFTPNEWFLGCQVDSADSSTWLSAIRWGRYKETAALRPFSYLPGEFRYQLGDNVTNRGRPKSILVSIIGCDVLQRNWRNHTVALQAHTGEETP